MKIFVLLSRFPYPIEKGDKLRAYHQISVLSKNHEIILCAIHEGKMADDFIDPLKPYCRAIKIIQLSRFHIFLNLVKGIFSGLPFQAAYFYSSGAQVSIREMIEKHNPDVIYCQLIRMSEYVRKEKRRKILDYMDAFSKGVERRIANSPFFLKPLLRIEHRRLLKYEVEISSEFSGLAIISEQDKKFIKNRNVNPVQVVPNGVDFNFFKPKKTNQEFDLVFTGNLAYPPNADCAVHLAQDIMPLILKKNPSVTLLISGAAPGARVKSLAGKNITVRGWTDDIRDSYSSSGIFVAPMRLGSGMQNKILEAMSMNLPCVVSALVNNAIGAEPVKEIIVADTEIEFASAVIYLLNSEEEKRKMANRGNEFVRKNFSWEQGVRKLESLFR